MNIRSKIASLADRACSIRQALHSIPEEGYGEIKTAQYIKEILEGMGLDTYTTAKTGVYCLIPGRNADRTIAFRADMDGLSVKEQTGVDFESVHPNMMHACGHDGHMSILLLMAIYLQENHIVPETNVMLIFQPAEEGPGGAKAIVEEGILAKYHVEEIYGCHIMPDLMQGCIATRKGPMMAQTGEVYIHVTGKSAHGAAPHMGKDAIVAASHLVLALQSIVSRNVDPVKTSLITIGTMSGGERLNVIASDMQLNGTMRAYEESVYQFMKRRVEEIAGGVSALSECKIQVDFLDMYPPVVNDGDLFEKFTSLLEADDWIEASPLMIAEDFSFFQKEIPGLFFYLGSRNEEKGFVHGLHDGRFNFDESILLNGVEAFVRILDREGASL